jgi:DNA-binding CsgD family transcriptional regulator
MPIGFLVRWLFDKYDDISYHPVMVWKINPNIHFEIFGMLMLFAMFWLLFYRLHYQESTIRRILLIICMALYHPLLSVQLPVLLRMALPFAMIAVLAVLAGGEKRGVNPHQAAKRRRFPSAWITAVYFLGATVFIDAIATAMVLGLTDTVFSNKDLYFYGNISIYIVLFMAVIIYYLIMRSVPQDAIDRIPLRIWLIFLLIQPVGATVFYVPLDSLLTQLEAGYNNFLFLGSFLSILFVLNLVILYSFIKFASGYSARLLAGELSKTPPVYSPQNGLSPEFIEKYGLSDREAEVAEALLRGNADKEIAALLYIAVNTVQVHLKSIYRKTDASGRYALMALVGLDKEQRANRH